MESANWVAHDRPSYCIVQLLRWYWRMRRDRKEGTRKRRTETQKEGKKERHKKDKGKENRKKAWINEGETQKSKNDRKTHDAMSAKPHLQEHKSRIRLNELQFVHRFINPVSIQGLSIDAPVDPLAGCGPGDVPFLNPKDPRNSQAARSHSRRAQSFGTSKRLMFEISIFAIGVRKW